MSLFDSGLRSFDDARLQQIIADRSDLSPSEYLVIADELLQRNIEIQGLKQKFESLVRSLNNQRIQYIDSYDFEFSKATVITAVHELRQRKLNSKKWFVHDGEQQNGPLDFIELLQFLDNTKSDKHKVWAEGMAKWLSLDKLPHLSKPYFFRQKMSEAEKIVSASSVRSKSSVPLWAGILQLIAFPFWFIFSLFSPINGIWSYTGIALPAFISMSMCLLSIPMGIGLIQAKKWAYQIKVASAVIVIAWFFSKVYIDDSSQIWLFMAIWELIILTFVLNRTSAFN